MPGAILYQGPSTIDGAPIFVTAIWSSKNRKTGAMIQTYVMRSDIDPLAANKYGEDFSICGDCPHKGVPTLDPERSVAEQRACYVNLGQGPLMVWRAYQRGNYPLLDTQKERRDLGLGQRIRIGSYGDAAAVPGYVWKDLLHSARGWTGYTHNSADTAYCMVSADDLATAQRAWRLGQRTFRIVQHALQLQPNEVLCPASAEAGHRTTCVKCMLCSGSELRAKSVAIVAHGPGRRFIEAVH